MNAVAGKKRATGMSIFSISGSLGFAIGPLLTTALLLALGLAVTVGGITAPLFGHIADLYSVQAALSWLACVPLLATALALTLPRPWMSGARATAALE